MLNEIKLYQNKTTIRFDDGRHIFYGPKGEYLTSVTGATGIIDKSGPLMYWAVNLSRDYLLGKINKGAITEEDILEASKQHRVFKKKAADIGTLIHEWCSNWILGKKPKMPEDEKVVNGITAFLKFQKEHKLKWLESERYIYSKKHNYAGILDAIAKEGKKLVLVDFKSSNGIYEEMYFQVAGYQIAWEEEMNKKIDKRIIVRFGKEDGEFEIKELDEDDKDKRVFLACLDIKRRMKELSKNNGSRF